MNLCLDLKTRFGFFEVHMVTTDHENYCLISQRKPIVKTNEFNKDFTIKMSRFQIFMLSNHTKNTQKNLQNTCVHFIHAQSFFVRP